MPETDLAVSVPEEELAALDRAVADGRFASRSEAIRLALRQVLAGASDAEIDESFRRAYHEHPEEDWIGEVGLHLLAERVREEREGD